MSALNSAYIGLTLLPQSLVWLGSMTSTYSAVRLGFLPPVLDLFHAGLNVTIRRFSHLEASSFAYGMAWMETSLSAPDFVHPGLTLIPQRLLRLESSMTAYGMTQPKVLLLLLDHACFGLIASSRSLVCPDFAFAVFSIT
jgi:hypothetical protein